MSRRQDFTAGLAQVCGRDATSLEVDDLVGGASNRTYHRVTSGGNSWVVMQLAHEPIRSEEATSGPTPAELPFLTMQRILSEAGVSVPRIHHVDEARGHLWLDDLGDKVLLDQVETLVGRPRVAAYRPAIQLLADFQRATRTGDAICFQRAFEPALLRWELDHYREWRLEAQLEQTLSPAVLRELAVGFDDLVSRIADMPQRVVHRDYQSTNLMVTDPWGLVLIDFQDALMGSWVYDLVALLRDSYVALPLDEVAQLLDAYAAVTPGTDRTVLERDFHLQTVQRKLKDSGRFVYIDRVKGNPHYLQYIQDSLGYVRDALRLSPELSGLRDVLAELDPALR